MSKGSNIARLLCLFPAIFLVTSGMLLLFAHSAADTVYGMKGQNALQNSPIVFAMGIRQFTIGLGIIVLALMRELKALGLIMLVGAIVPLSDFVIFMPVIGWTSALRHAGPVPVILALGLYLLWEQSKYPKMSRD